MKKTILFPLLSVMLSSAFSQTFTQNDPFPAYTPFTDVNDVEQNKRDYYAIESDPYTNDGCTFTNNSCARHSVRYNFDPGSDFEDGNSAVDIYYTNDPAIDPVKGKPLVVLLHGIEQDRTRAQDAIRRAIEMSKRGYVAIVPDYTTALDTILWGKVSQLPKKSLPINPFEACYDKEEYQYVIQQSVRDIRAAIRRTLYLADINPLIKVDESSIFLWGYSWGAIAALHAAYTDISDYPSSGTQVTINDVNPPYTFPDNLDDIDICPPGDVDCSNSIFYTSYDLKDNLKGVSSVAGVLLDTIAIDLADDFPLLTFHGTCDGITPFDSPTSREATFRRQVTEFLDTSPIESVPCHDDEFIELQYKIFGSEAIVRQLDNLEQNPSFNPYRGHFKVCGVGHRISSYYGIKWSIQVDDLFSNTINIIEYETIRFFSNILNGDNQTDFSYNLSQDKRSDRNVDVPEFGMTRGELDAFYCSSVPQYSDTPILDNGGDGLLFYPKGTTLLALDYISENICPNCDPNAPNFIGTIRWPYFIDNDVDNNRYPNFTPESCSTASMLSKDYEPQNLNYNASTVRIFNNMGEFVKAIEWVASSETSNIERFTKYNHELEKGFYYIHFDSGEKRAVLIK
ncbi:MAG: hypothetical protein AAGC47_07855 [Bacteroidota bacterium]